MIYSQVHIVYHECVYMYIMMYIYYTYTIIYINMHMKISGQQNPWVPGHPVCQHQSCSADCHLHENGDRCPTWTTLSLHSNLRAETVATLPCTFDARNHTCCTSTLLGVQGALKMCGISMNRWTNSTECASGIASL